MFVIQCQKKGFCSEKHLWEPIRFFSKWLELLRLALVTPDSHVNHCGLAATCSSQKPFLEGKVLKCSQLVRFGSSFHFSPFQKIQKGPFARNSRILCFFQLPAGFCSFLHPAAWWPLVTLSGISSVAACLRRLPTLPTLPRPNGFIVLLELLYWLLVTSSNLFVRHRKLFTYIIRSISPLP